MEDDLQFMGSGVQEPSQRSSVSSNSISPSSLETQSKLKIGKAKRPPRKQQSKLHLTEKFTAKRNQKSLKQIIASSPQTGCESVDDQVMIKKPVWFKLPGNIIRIEERWVPAQRHEVRLEREIRNKAQKIFAVSTQKFRPPASLISEFVNKFRFSEENLPSEACGKIRPSVKAIVDKQIRIRNRNIVKPCYNSKSLSQAVHVKSASLAEQNGLRMNEFSGKELPPRPPCPVVKPQLRPGTSNLR
jgi:hypothetical protein